MDIRDSLMKAVSSFQSGRLGRAEYICRKVLKADPEQADAWHLMGAVAIQRGKHKRAVELIDKAIRQAPDMAQAHYNKGNALAELGEFDPAVAAYQKAITIEPLFGDAHYNLGNLLAAYGQLQDAVVAYEKAIGIAPEFANAYVNLGNAFRKLGQLDDANSAYKKALEIDETLAPAFLHLGTIAKLKGNFKGAKVALDQAIKLDPKLALAHSERAHVLLLQGQKDKAIAGYREALDLDPNFAWGLMSLSSALVKAGRLDEAIDVSQKAVRLRRTFEWPFLGREPVGRVVVLKGMEDGYFQVEPDDSMGSIGGMSNLDSHIDRNLFAQTSYYVDGLDPERAFEALPECDVILNAITDADAVPKSHAIVAAIAKHAPVPVVNRPEIVAKTRRHENAKALGELDHIRFPKTVRLEETPKSSEQISKILADAEIDFPVLARLAGTHTGETLTKTDNVKGLIEFFANNLSGPYYLTEYVEFANDKGAYQKLRAYLVDGVVYPSQCFISKDWKVHISDELHKFMARNAWTIDAAKRFHADPEDYLGKDAFRALQAVYDKIPLDFFGIDFTQLADGTLLFFEANATMRVPFLDTGELDVSPFRIPSIQAIENALQQLLEDRIRRGRNGGA